MLPSSNNKRLIKNTLFLYIRMFFTMGIALFTSRVILKSLGIEDFGIYNIVGGTVALFSFINITLTGATSRFLTYELGVGNTDRLQATFSTSIFVHFIIAGVILILAETIGLWLLHNKINIPEEKFNQAIYVYQISILTSLISIIQVPFTATIISHENMSIYAYISIYECLMKLIIAYVLYWIPTNRLIIYSILIASVAITLLLFYIFFCNKKYKECSLTPQFNISILMPVLKYSGWDLYGNMSTMARTYGISVILNLFFGALINAATGIANQVQQAVMGFVENFMTASRPQIVKYYASNRHEDMCELIYNASKYSFLLLFLISFPLIIESNFILHLWLGEVPNYTLQFTQLSLLIGWNSALFRPIVYGIHATGKIKTMSFINGTIILLIIPLSYFSFKHGASPIWSYIFNITLLILTSIINLIQLQKLISTFSINKFLHDVLINITKVIIPTSLLIVFITHTINEGILRLLLNLSLSIFIVPTLTWFFITEKSTRKHISAFILSKIKNI